VAPALVDTPTTLEYIARKYFNRDPPPFLDSSTGYQQIVDPCQRRLAPDSALVALRWEMHPLQRSRVGLWHVPSLLSSRTAFRPSFTASISD